MANKQNWTTPTLASLDASQTLGSPVQDLSETFVAATNPQPSPEIIAFFRS